jgi:hypothetical protein
VIAQFTKENAILLVRHASDQTTTTASLVLNTVSSIPQITLAPVMPTGSAATVASIMDLVTTNVSSALDHLHLSVLNVLRTPKKTPITHVFVSPNGLANSVPNGQEIATTLVPSVLTDSFQPIASHVVTMHSSTKTESVSAMKTGTVLEIRLMLTVINTSENVVCVVMDVMHPAMVAVVPVSRMLIFLTRNVSAIMTGLALTVVSTQLIVTQYVTDVMDTELPQGMMYLTV